jgi:hypothetical protein
MVNGIAIACLMSAMGVSAAQRDRAIVRLVGRDATISVVSTASGPRYSAVDARGTAICSMLSVAELKRTHPELHRQVESAICADADCSALLAGPD